MKQAIKESEYRFTLNETAEILGITKSTVELDQHNALAKLRAELEKRGYRQEDFLEKTK